MADAPFDIADLTIDEYTRDMSQRIATDAVGDPDHQAIDDDADELFNQYLLDHRTVERILREKYNAPRSVKRKGVLDAVDEGDRIGLRVFRWHNRHITHYVIGGTVDFDDAGELAKFRVDTPVVYSWVDRYPEGLEELTKTSNKLAKVPPLVEVTDFETPEVYIAEGHSSTDGPIYDAKECYGVIRDAVVGPDSLSELVAADEPDLFGGDR